MHWERNLVISFYQLYVFLLLQIRQLSDQGDGSINVMTKGKQRFRIYRVMTAPDGAVIFNLVACLWKDPCLDCGFRISARDVFSALTILDSSI